MFYFERMIKFIAITLFLTFYITITGCGFNAIMSQQIDDKLELPSAREMNLSYINRNLQVEKHSFISFDPALVLLSIDNNTTYNSEYLIIPPGIHKLGIMYRLSGSFATSYTDTIYSTFDFQPGKFYSVKYIVNNELLTIVIEEAQEISNKLNQYIESIKNFMTYSQTNPLNIIGTYKIEHQTTMLTQILNEFEFSFSENNIIVYLNLKLSNSKTGFHTNYIYNDKWLVLFVTEMSENNKKISSFNPNISYPVEIRYTRQDNDIIMQGISFNLGVSTLPSVYHRIK